MNAIATDAIDAYQARLHAAGWSIGDMAVRAAGGIHWMVFAHKGDQRVVSKARRQVVAWQDAVRLAVSVRRGTLFGGRGCTGQA